jgi:hypothetical protein
MDTIKLPQCDYFLLDVPQLRIILEDRCLSSIGTKAELVNRIRTEDRRMMEEKKADNVHRSSQGLDASAPIEAGDQASAFAAFSQHSDVIVENEATLKAICHEEFSHFADSYLWESREAEIEAVYLSRTSKADLELAKAKAQHGTAIAYAKRCVNAHKKILKEDFGKRIAGKNKFGMSYSLELRWPMKIIDYLSVLNFA